MGVNQVIGTEQYNRATGKGPAEINFNHFPVRVFITTVSDNSLVTDSAAAGTAKAVSISARARKRENSFFMRKPPEHWFLGYVLLWFTLCAFILYEPPLFYNRKRSPRPRRFRALFPVGAVKFLLRLPHGLLQHHAGKVLRARISQPDN
jgi:hypothetical protein